MRFHIGPTSYDSWKARIRKHEQWHLKFAWFPTRMTDTEEARWLEYVERRRVGPLTRYPSWEYRDRDYYPDTTGFDPLLHPKRMLQGKCGPDRSDFR